MADSSWGLMLVMGLVIFLVVAGTLLAAVRTLPTRSVVLRCPNSGLFTVADGYLTAVVRCGAQSGSRRVSCGTPCLTGGAQGSAEERSPTDLLGD